MRITAPQALYRIARNARRRCLDDEIAAYKRNLDDVVGHGNFNNELLPSCQVVRNRINKLLDAGIMNKTEFSEAIGCRDTNTLSDFLKQKGTDGGRNSPVWVNAWVWFRQREVANLKMPDVKKRRSQEDGMAGSAVRGSASKTTSSLPDITDIYLEGEEDDDVSVYDTCDEIRRKINAHLRTPGVTQAQFCRDLYAQLHVPKVKSIQSKQLADFRRQKGPRTGAKSTVFYAAYVYFEKLRIAQGKRKTKHREDMEDIWESNGGFDRETDHRTQYGPPSSPRIAGLMVTDELLGISEGQRRIFMSIATAVLLLCKVSTVHDILLGKGSVTV